MKSSSAPPACTPDSRVKATNHALRSRQLVEATRIKLYESKWKLQETDKQRGGMSCFHILLLKLSNGIRSHILYRNSRHMFVLLKIIHSSSFYIWLYCTTFDLVRITRRFSYTFNVHDTVYCLHKWSALLWERNLRCTVITWTVSRASRGGKKRNYSWDIWFRF